MTVSMLQTDELLSGRYRLGRLLGSGGFGSVYLATDERLHRPVAIKVCSTRGLPLAEAEEAARLFQSEALTLARLRHPGLTAIWDYFNQDDNWYLVMEYVPGETLRTLQRQAGGPLPYGDALSYARQLCAVLGYLHRQSPPVVFRDLKPANIMVTPEGQLKLIDFGIARLFSPGKLADTAQFGTPGYAPPEQYGGQTEPRSDIYSMGVVLHQMLTGHNPASTPFVYPAVRSLNQAVPAPIEELIALSTSYDISRRVPSAEEFCRLMDLAVERPAPTLLAQRQVAAPREQRLWSPPPRALPSPPPSIGLGRSLVMIVLLLLLLGSLAAGAFLLRNQIAALRDDLSLASPIGPLVQRPASYAVFSATNEAGSEYLYRVDIANGNVETLLEMPQGTSASQPAISPDGRRIAYTRGLSVPNPDGEGSRLALEVWLMNADGSDQRAVLPGYQSRAPAWSPDGRYLALEIVKNAPGNRLWLDHDVAFIDLQSGSLRPVADSNRWEGGPAWSPDGRWLAYQGHVSGGTCMQLFVTEIGGASSEQVTALNDEGCASVNEGAVWPDWSPDGSRLAFEHKYQGRERIALLDLETRELTILDTGELQAGYPRWSPKGSALLFEQGSGTDTGLARINVDTCATGCQVEAVPTSLPGSHLADWQ